MIKKTFQSSGQQELNKPEPFDLLSREVYLNLVRTHAALESEFTQLFKQHQISQPLYNVLKVVVRGEKEGVPSQSIAQYMIARDPDITRLVNRLVKDGLVERHRSQSDRRIVSVKITPLGLNKLEELEEPVKKLHYQQLKHIDADKLKLLNELLVKARYPTD